MCSRIVASCTISYHPDEWAYEKKRLTDQTPSHNVRWCSLLGREGGFYPSRERAKEGQQNADNAKVVFGLDYYSGDGAGR
jgi:hypothetical protein